MYISKEEPYQGSGGMRTQAVTHNDEVAFLSYKRFTAPASYFLLVIVGDIPTLIQPS